MSINADKTHLWKADVERSIDFYNDWFVRFAPETYRTQRKVATVRFSMPSARRRTLRTSRRRSCTTRPDCCPFSAW
jgi:hypothetical protein